MQAAVVGLSVRSDVTELLEKRVKSRFSYRRRLVLEPGTAEFEHEGEGPPALLAALLRLHPDVGSSSPSQAFCAHFNAATAAALEGREVLPTLRLLCDKGAPAALLTGCTVNGSCLASCSEVS